MVRYWKESTQGNNIYIGSDTRVNNITIRRCYLNQLIFNSSFDTTHTCINAVIEQNVITSDLDCNNADFIIIRNNFIQGRIAYITQNALIENNILYYFTEAWNGGQYTLYSVYNSLIRNNIFM